MPTFLENLPGGATPVTGLPTDVVKFRGAWNGAQAYDAGDMVTFRTGLYVARNAIPAGPYSQASYAALIQARSNLLAYWPLTEQGTDLGAVYADATEHGYDVAVANGNGITHVPTPIGDATAPQMPNGYRTDDELFDALVGTTTSGLPQDGDPYSLEVWLNVVADDNWESVISIGGPSGAFLGFDMEPPNEIETWETDNFADTENTGPNVFDGQWHHIVLTDDAAGTLHIYVDGVDNTQYSDEGTSNGVTYGPDSIIALGNDAGTIVQATSEGYAGALSNCAIYGRALSADEVAASFAAFGQAQRPDVDPADWDLLTSVPTDLAFTGTDNRFSGFNSFSGIACTSIFGRFASFTSFGSPPFWAPLFNLEVVEGGVSFIHGKNILFAPPWNVDVFDIGSNGDIVTIGDISATALAATANDSALTPLTVAGTAGQTADLQQWKNSTGTVLSRIDASGAFQGASGFLWEKIQSWTMVDDTVAGLNIFPDPAKAYRTLVVYLNGRCTAPGTGTSPLHILFNGDTGGGHYDFYAAGLWDSYGQNSALLGLLPNAGCPGSMTGSVIITIPGFNTAGLSRTCEGQYWAQTARTSGGFLSGVAAATWFGVGTVVRIDLYVDGFFDVGTTADVYGIF